MERLYMKFSDRLKSLREDNALNTAKTCKCTPYVNTSYSKSEILSPKLQ